MENNNINQKESSKPLLEGDSENEVSQNSSFFSENVSSINGLEPFPKLRFLEFKNTYKKIKLNKAVERIQRKDPTSEAPVMMLSAASGFIMQSEKYSRENAGQSLKKYILLKKGELAYNHGASKYKPFGCCFELKEEEARIPYVYHCFAVKENNDKSYIARLLNNQKIDQQLKRLISSSVRMDGLLNISYEEYTGIDLYLPSLPEQQKIATFLSLVDTRIEKQRQLVESLKKYKRGVIQYYFDNILGESIKLKNILIEVDEKTKINNQHPVISSTKQGLFWQDDYFNKDIASSDNKGYKILRRGQVVFSPQNLWMGNINYNEDFEIGIVSPSYKIYDINKMFDPYFVSVLLKTPIAMKEFFLASEQGASIVRRNLKMDLFENITFQIPSLDKQKDISIRLYKLQKNLDLNIKILDYLIKFKQGLLQQMFI